MKPESALRARIVNALRSKGVHVRVIHQDGHSAGMLDLNCVYKGRALHLELKTPQNVKGMSNLQLKEQADIRAAGGVAEECRSIESALDILGRIDKGEL